MSMQKFGTPKKIEETSITEEGLKKIQERIVDQNVLIRYHESQTDQQSLEDKETEIETREDN